MIGAAPGFRTWFTQFVLGVILVGPVTYYGILHLAMRIPLRALLAPWLALTLLIVGLGPLFYWSGKYARKSGGDLRPLIVLSGATATAGPIVILHYASKLGLLSADVARGSIVAALIAVPPCTVAAYYLERKLFPTLFSPAKRDPSTMDEGRSK